MRLGTRGRYAVMAMIDLASKPNGHPIILSEIAARQGVSLLYLEQLFVLLRRKDYVRSVRGKNGGYALNRPATDLFILDIVSAVGEQLKITRCDRGRSCLPGDGQCQAHVLWESMEDILFHYLSKISLADVCTGRLPAVSFLEGS